MQQDTPDADKAARSIAENVYAAFARMATAPTEPLAEQAVLTRLVETIRPQIPQGAMQAIVEAAVDRGQSIRIVTESDFRDLIAIMPP